LIDPPVMAPRGSKGDAVVAEGSLTPVTFYLGIVTRINRNWLMVNNAYIGKIT